MSEQHTTTHPPAVPLVEAAHFGDTVLVELEAEQARVLARVLAHYDTLTQPDGVQADGYQPQVWHHVLIRLLAEAAHASVELPAPAAARLLGAPGAAAVVRQLRLVPATPEVSR